MKGYKLDKTLYIFDATPAVIPVSVDDVDVIYVQQELLAAYVSDNPDAASKIKPYNYKMIAVNKLPWADYINEDILEDPELAWSAESATAQIGETNTFPTLTNSHSVTVSYSSSDSEKATIDATTGEITLVAAGDTTISAIFAGDATYEAQTVTYTLTVQAAQPEVPTYELTIVNNLPEGWSCEMGTSPYGHPETYTPIDVSASPIRLIEGDIVFVKVLNENSEPVNYLSGEGNEQIDYAYTHGSNEIMQQLNVYCSIEGDFTDEMPIDVLGYEICSQDIAESDFHGAGESFGMLLPLTLTIQQP